MSHMKIASQLLVVVVIRKATKVEKMNWHLDAESLRAAVVETIQNIGKRLSWQFQDKILLSDGYSYWVG